ncbi:hypothetical protein HYT23_05515 [Candidatus Pacearchaeota archaeon]|nr:hypothetical protein [Candidatus Pacearchaeota archaeon]
MALEEKIQQQMNRLARYTEQKKTQRLETAEDYIATAFATDPIGFAPCFSYDDRRELGKTILRLAEANSIELSAEQLRTCLSKFSFGFDTGARLFGNEYSLIAETYRKLGEQDMADKYMAKAAQAFDLEASQRNLPSAL